MKSVKSNQLKEGFVTAADIKSKTQFPIVKQNTVLEQTHIDVIRAFLIPEVAVLGNPAVDKKPGEKNDEAEQPAPELEEEISSNHPLYLQYSKTVFQYKKLFSSWRNGYEVNGPLLKGLFVPLYEMFKKDRLDLILLHHFSNKEEYLSHHAVAAGLISAAIGERLGCSEEEIVEIGIAGMLADCGMAKIDDYLLKKTDALNQREMERLRKHSILSYQMLKNNRFMTEGMALGVLQHHEREDGSGYPLKIKGGQIHPYAKIIAVADTFHAMVSERYYQPKQSPYKVIEILSKDLIGQFAPDVITKLLDLIQPAIGMKVRLTNYESGEIVFVQPQEPLRPMVRLENTGAMINLLQERSLYIDDVLV